MSVQSSSHPALSCADQLAANTSDFLLLAGRILLGWIFVGSGYGKPFDMAGYGGGFPIMFGRATRYFVVVMVIFMLVATFTSHRYWDFTDLVQRRIQDSAFYKNVAILGGLLFLFTTGAGKLSVDRWLSKTS